MPSISQKLKINDFIPFLLSTDLAYIQQDSQQSRTMSISTADRYELTKDPRELSKLKKSRREEAPNYSRLSMKKSARGKSSIYGSENDDMQEKITKYISMSNSISKAKLELEEINPLQTSKQNEIVEQLMKKLKEKEEEIKMIKLKKEVDEEKKRRVEEESREQTRKGRFAMAKSMLEVAQLKRKERSQINPQLGYFTESFRKFVEGTIFVQLRDQIKASDAKITKLESEKKNTNPTSEEFMIRSSSCDFLIRENTELKKQLETREREVIIYKERLKLVQKEQKSEYYLQEWPIIYSKYQTLELLGAGGFGQVYKCYDFQENRVVAIKRMIFDLKINSKHREQFYRHVKREIEIQKQLNHPNIAKLINVLEINQEKNCAIFELEYCQGPELSTYLRKHKTLPEFEAKLIIKQILSALNYLYNLKEKVIHYDLKPGNIIFHHGTIKILDFGLCKVMNDGDQTKMELTSQGVGTYYYLPPETFETYDPKICSKVDIWSVGVIFFEMLYGRRPFGHGFSQNQIFQNGIILKARKVQFPADPIKKPKVSEAAKQFICACLKYDPSERLSPPEAYDHPYMKK